MGEMYLKMGRLDEAVTKYKEALKIKADFGSDWSISYIYALKENYSEALKWVDQFIAMAPSPGVRVQGNVWKGLYHSWSGNVNRAMSDLDIAANLADVIGNEMWKAHVDRTKGWIYYDRGELERGQRFFQAWYDFFSEFYPPYKPYYSSNLYCYLGLVDVKAGRIETARSRLAEVDSLLPELAPHHRGTIAFRRDALYGEVLLASDSLEKAIVFSESATPLGMLPLMHPWTLLPYNVPFRKDVLARAYQRTGEIDKAISEYERLIAVDPNSLERPLIHPLYHYCLANLYLEKGLSDEAVSQYEQFLDIWKDAEEDLPELIDAKAKLARLKGAS
jgi:tetratricopeptide (TPR) repeat protein